MSSDLASLGKPARPVTPAALPISLVLVAVQSFGTIVGRALLPPGAEHAAGSLWKQLVLTWDGWWYHSIATSGYSWQPPAEPTHYQNIAFFPLQGLLDRIVIFAAGPDAVAAIALVSLAAGLASIFCFETLAREVIGDAAPLATALYAFWPASSFYLMGYPTGIIALCVIGALRAHIEGRDWVAALWLGIGTAAAPTVVFVGAALGVHHLVRWARGGASGHRLAVIVGWGLLSLSGLLAFMAYQAVAFHDPFAFVQAQEAWGESPGLLGRVSALLDPRQYVRQPVAGLLAIGAGWHLLLAGQLRAGAIQFQLGLQLEYDLVAFILAIIGLRAASRALRERFAAIAWAGWAVFAGYLWFVVATAQGVRHTPRLIFPALAIFLGLGTLAQRAGRLPRVLVVGGFIALSGMEMAFTAAGFWIL